MGKVLAYRPRPNAFNLEDVTRKDILQFIAGVLVFAVCMLLCFWA